MSMGRVKLFFTLALLGGLYEDIGAESFIHIENNAYQQIVVLIGDRVPENWNLVDKIKDVFTDASRFLYHLTRKQAYFGNISIVVPKAWDNSRVTHNLTFETSKDIWIDVTPSPGFHTPYASGVRTCGRPGSFIKLTNDYMMDATIAVNYGPYEKLIAHEWSHLRYGVFDEYAYPKNPKFYLNTNNQYEAVKCSRAIKGTPVNQITGQSCRIIQGKPEEDCVYRVDMSGEPLGYASIMFMQHYDQVLKEHEDFRNNTPREVESVQPKFRIVQRGYPRSVLVLDVSGSMTTNNRIGRLGQACRHFIRQIPDGNRVAIVQFSSDATVRLNMIEISDHTRKTAINAIPTTASGSTAIGKGIVLGLDLLRDSGGTHGANLVVVSDGGENAAPYIDDITQDVLDAGVIVDSVSISDGAETKVDKLADLTKGTKAHYSEAGASTALIDAFSALANKGVEDPADQKQNIVSEAVTLSPDTPRNETVYMDGTVGKNTVFTVQYQSQSVNLKITDPDGTQYGAGDMDHDSTSNTWEFEPSGIAKSGAWVYEITSTVQQDVSVTIITERSSNTLQPYVAEAEWGLKEQDGRLNEKQVIYITVSQGSFPVLDAEVTAIIDMPGGATTVSFICRDNGAGADNVAEDGVYSAYFLMQNTNGRYNLKAMVKGTSVSRVDTGSIAGVGSLGIFQQQDTSQESTGQFQRSTPGGAFQLTNYQPRTYPPDAVSDLELEGVDYEGRVVTVTWTATGDQADSGQALRYEIRFSFQAEQFEQNFTHGGLVHDHMISGNLTQPKMAGEIEKMHITLYKKDGATCVLGMQVLGTHGFSETSNLILVPLEEPMFAEVASQSVNLVAILLGVLIPVIVLVAMATVAIILWKKKMASKTAPSGGDKADYDNTSLKI